MRAKVAGTPAAEVLEKALNTRIYELQDEFLPDGPLKDRLGYEAASTGRNPLAFQFAYASLNAVDEETGIKPPNGYVRGGVGVISRLFRESAEEAGVVIHTEHEVERFLVESGKVVGIRLAGGEEVRSPVVASNLDPKRTFLRLMPQEHLNSGFRARIDSLVTHVSCYKFLAVISELPQWTAWDGDPDLPSTGSVVISLNRAETSEAHDDLEAGLPPRKPLISYSIPSAVDDSLTQPGVPYRFDLDLPRRRPSCGAGRGMTRAMKLRKGSLTRSRNMRRTSAAPYGTTSCARRWTLSARTA